MKATTLTLFLFIIPILIFSQNYEAGQGADSGSGTNVTAVGSNAGNSTSTASDNSFFGHEAGNSISSGNENSFFGNRAGHSISSGRFNSIFGYEAGMDITTSEYNSIFGNSAARSVTGGYNTIIGGNAGERVSDGFLNCVIGYRAADAGKIGNGNIIIGSYAGPRGNADEENFKLYIDSYNFTTDPGDNRPLIYGEFNNDFVRINGTFEVTAGLSNPSSRSLKNQFEFVDDATVLSKLASLNIQQWTYKHRPDEKHIGPIAEEFYELFSLGEGDTKISTIDADGVMMLSIQALIKENDELKANNIKIINENKKFRTELNEIKLLLDKLMNSSSN